MTHGHYASQTLNPVQIPHMKPRVAPVMNASCVQLFLP